MTSALIDLPHELTELRAAAMDVAQSVVRAQREKVDSEGHWPRESMEALGDAGLLGLHVPRDLGGQGQGMLALALVTELLGAECGSTGLVFGMHAVGSKAIAAKATDHHREHYLAPIAAGEHVTTLALSEPGTGVHFYLPRTTFQPEGDHYLLEGQKSFVTSAGHADSYVLSVVRAGSDMDPGTFSCLVLDDGAEGASWADPWNGFGMRGNASRGLRLASVPVPAENLLGEEGDEIWFVFEVIAPYFLVAMAGTYLGVAQSALDLATEHLAKRTYDHTGTRVATADVVAHRLGQLWARVQGARQLLHHAAAAGDAGRPGAREALFACKAEIAEVAVQVTNESMTLTGGIAYGRGARLAQNLRDARASHVMAPSTDLLYTWIGRSLVDLPLL